jgi:hypothetical protein
MTASYLDRRDSYTRFISASAQFLATGGNA